MSFFLEQDGNNVWEDENYTNEKQKEPSSLLYVVMMKDEKKADRKWCLRRWRNVSDESMVVEGGGGRG